MPNRITDAIQEALALQEQATKAEKEKEAASQKAYAALLGLGERVKAGESTGDRVKDFVLARYHILGGEIESNLRALDEKVAKHTGQFVLVVHRTERPCGRRGGQFDFDQLDYFVEEHLFLGVLTSGLRLDIATCQCALPTGQYVRYLNGLSEHMYLAQGDVHDTPLLLDFGFKIDQLLRRLGTRQRGTQYQEKEFALEVKVGDEEVKQWFDAQPEKKYLVTFYNMTKMLGRTLPESPELRAELKARRGAVCKRLLELEPQATNLQVEIDRIYRARAEGVYSSDGDVCEDEDDAYWISQRPRQDLKEVIAQIKRAIREACELGMEGSETVGRLSAKYEKLLA